MALTNEQNAAINTCGHNLLVSASAGSGKTLVLTKRVLNNILKRKISVNEMLILTFTEASAAEMKEKIKKVLKDSGQDDEYRLVDSSYISTIDAFYLSIVKRYSYLLGVTNNIEITDDIYFKYFYQNLLDQYIEELYDAKDARLEECIKTGKDKSNRSLKSAVMEISTCLDKRFDKDKFIEDFNGNDFNRVKDLFNKEFDKIKTKLCSLLDDLISLSGSSSSHIDAINKVKEAITNSEEALIDTIPAKNAKCQEGFSELRTKLTKLVKSEYNLYKDDLIDLDNNISKMNGYSNFVIDIIKELDSRMMNYKKDHNLYSFKDITKLIYKLIKENEDVRDELKYSFKEIMLDEYQDTDKIQDEIFEMISNDNLFQVGDVKQSIYEFRDADPSIFLNKYASYQNPNNSGEVIDLTKNFRSRREVVETVNKVFTTLDSLGVGGLKYDKRHSMNYGLTDYDKQNDNKDDSFEIMTYEIPKGNPKKYKNYEYEAFIVAEDIKKRVNKELVLNENRKEDGNYLRTCKYSDFTILSQAGTHFDSIKKIFNYLNIPLKVTKDEEVKEGHYLDVIRNIFKLIYNLNEMNHKNYKSCSREWDNVKYALTSVLRSYLYEMSDEEIYEVIKNKNLDSEAYTLAKDIASKVDDLSNLEIFNLVDEAYEPLSRDWVYKDINSEMAKHEFVYNLAKSSFSFADFVSMLDYISRNDVTATFKVEDDGEDSVLLSTIHHSKGLEYPYVYMIQNERDFDQKEVGSYPVGIVINDLVIADLGGNFKSLIKIIEKERLSNLIYEKVRLLYVEMTRAREKLIMVDEYSSKQIDPSNVNSYHDIFQMIYYLSGNNCYKMMGPNITKAYLAPNVKKANTLVNNANYIPLRSIYEVKEETKPLRASTTKFGLMDSNTKALLKQGISLHKAFEMADFSKESTSNPKVQAFLNTAIMQDIKNAKFYKEYEFIDQNGLNGIIDLMIVKDNEIDIVDYKTKNIKSDAYQKQVNIYGNYIKSLNLGKEIKLYLYSIMDEELEEVAWL